MEQELVRKMESCLKLHEAYQEQYRLTKKKLQQVAHTPKPPCLNPQADHSHGV